MYKWSAAEHTSPVRVPSDLLLCSDLPDRYFVIDMDVSPASAGDRELQEFLAQEQQKLQFQNQVSRCVTGGRLTGMAGEQADRDMLGQVSAGQAVVATGWPDRDLSD